ncbi:MAG: DNA polymerase IV [Actinomycetota bacterium]
MSRGPRPARRDWGDDDTGCTILHVDMDSFFAAVELLERPELAGRPVVVGGGPRGVVTSATYEARAFGIHAAMPISRARRLCPQAVFLPGRRGRYLEVSREVMAVISSTTPVFEPVSIDEAFLDVAGSLRRLGTPTRIATVVRERVREEVGVVASVGVATTKHVAKLASAAAKPDGMLLVPADRSVEFLHSLPVGALWGVGGRTGDVLASRGVRSVEDLAHVPVATLERWVGGAVAARLHELAWGRDPRPVETEHVEKSVGTETTFGSDVGDRGELERTVLRQSHDCARRLRAGGLEATRVGIKVRFSDFTTITRSRVLPAPSQVGGVIAAVARSLLDGVRIPPGGVRLIGVRAEHLVDVTASGFQWTVDGSDNSHRAELAMDAVRRRFGASSLSPASLLPPEDAAGT